MNIFEHLKNQEGYETCVYQDSLGYWTIGIGFCVDKRVAGAGLLPEEINYILNNRINIIDKELRHYKWYKDLNTVRREAMIRMAFNLGVSGLLSFKRMIAALKKQDWSKAAFEARDSKWSMQVGLRRVQSISNAILTGKDD
jgi:lysozyme